MLMDTNKAIENYCPWPGLKLACIRILELYCKVFEQPEYYQSSSR